MIHCLSSETLNILSDEFEVSLVGLDWVDQVVLLDVLFGVSQERSDSFDTRGTLQVLRGKQLVKVLLKVNTSSVTVDFQKLKNSHEDLFETFKVPVLVDDGVDDPGEEDLLGLVSKQEDKVVHLVDELEVLSIFNTPLGQNLFTNQVNQVSDVLVGSKVSVFLGVLETDLDLVE